MNYSGTWWRYTYAACVRHWAQSRSTIIRIIMNISMKKTTFSAALLVLCQVVAVAQPSALNLMPMPKELLLKEGKFRLTNKFDIKIEQGHNQATDSLLYRAVNRFYQQLNRKTGLIFERKFITPEDKIDSTSMVLMTQLLSNPSVGIDESYALGIDQNLIGIIANNTIGALRGLQ